MSLQENIHTNTSNGKFFFHVFGALAELEKDIIKERTMAGLEAAKARGRIGGRPRKLTKQSIKEISVLAKDPIKVSDLLKKFDISKTTFYRYVNQ